jgi:hypothetical protein
MPTTVVGRAAFAALSEVVAAKPPTTSMRATTIDLVRIPPLIDKEGACPKT